MPYRRRLTTGQTIALGCVLMLGLVGYELYCASEALSAKKWERVYGTIQQSEMVRQYGRSFSGRNRRSSELTVRYSYYFDGKPYTGDRVNFGGLGQLLDFNFGTLEKYPLHSSVAIYVDPNNPSRSVLERGFPMSATIALGLGVASLVGIAGIWILP